MKLPSNIVLAIFLGSLSVTEAVQMQLESNQDKMVQRTMMLELKQHMMSADGFDAADQADYAQLYNDSDDDPVSLDETPNEEPQPPQVLAENRVEDEEEHNDDSDITGQTENDQPLEADIEAREEEEMQKRQAAAQAQAEATE